MIRITTIALALAATFALSACNDANKELQSPCVGKEGSPCDRRPTNNWWLS